MSGGFEDQRQVKAWIASRGDPSFFNGFLSSVEHVEETFPTPSPRSKSPIARADLDAQTHVFKPCVAMDQHHERRAESH